jgi:hypothetical protein
VEEARTARKSERLRRPRYRGRASAVAKRQGRRRGIERGARDRVRGRGRGRRGPRVSEGGGVRCGWAGWAGLAGG